MACLHITISVLVGLGPDVDGVCTCEDGRYGLLRDVCLISVLLPMGK